MKTIQRAVSAGIGKPTIICLHSSGGSGAQWKGLADRMQQNFRVLAPDLYGHGTAPDWYGVPGDIVAADTARIAHLAAATSSAVHLVGHSYGGAIALRVALQYPHRVASVAVYEPVTLRVLFDYNRKQRAAAEAAEVADRVRRALLAGDTERAAERFIDYWAGTGQWARFAPDKRAAIAQRMPVIHSHFVSLRNDAIRLRDYADVASPVLYLSGRDTRASTRRIGELLTYALPHVEQDILNGMGHLGPITHAQAVAQRIARFVYRHAGSPVTERLAA